MEQEKIKVAIEERESRPPVPTPDIREGFESLLASFDAALRIYDVVRQRLSASTSPPVAAAPATSPPKTAISTEGLSGLVQRAQAGLIYFSPSRVPAWQRLDPTYLRPGDSLKTAQRAVIQRNLTALANSPIRHSIRLTLSPDELAALGNITSGPGSGAGGMTSDVNKASVDLSKLLAHIESRLQGTELYVAKYAPFAALDIDAEAETRLDRVTKAGS